MKIDKSVFATIGGALVILALGYGGTYVSGNYVLKSSAEPEKVTMTGDISSLFYSKLESDDSLYPWNYYPSGDRTETLSLEQEEIFYAEYGDELEQNVLYSLISMAADVEITAVEEWYAGEGQNILDSMKQGIAQDGTSMELYFYDDVIPLNGKKYQVKIACDNRKLLSFSCIRCREESVKESEEWDENKELLRTAISENPEHMLIAYEYMAAGYKSMYADPSDWNPCVDMYACGRDMVWETLERQELIEDTGTDKTGDEADVDRELEGNYERRIEMADEIQLGEIPVQMIELKDSVILVMGSEFTVGLYYDVITQKVVGFQRFGG